jgi:formamidopyrimidine-DNA glycosylase
MPELPEVNTVVLALAHHFAGDEVIGWRPCCKKLRKELPDKMQTEKILGKTIKRIFRRAKSIYFEFTGKYYLHIHLGMTGFFALTKQIKKYEKHEHLRLILKSGKILSFFDPRKFGVIEILAQLPKEVPEPFATSLTFEHLAALCNKSNRSVKSLIMDQKKIAGLGNIYANEALFKAGIHPQTPASELGSKQIGKMYNSILQVIDQAIKSGLKSLKPDYKINRNTAHFEIETLVYGQTGELCPKCKADKIKKIIVGGRGTFYCPVCQPL